MMARSNTQDGGLEQNRRWIAAQAFGGDDWPDWLDMLEKDRKEMILDPGTDVQADLGWL